jgi:small subunit ribosomal protein S29e
MSEAVKFKDKNFKNVKSLKMKKKDRKCKICGARKGYMRKYKLDICRRCFKDNATKLGFEKFE